MTTRRCSSRLLWAILCGAWLLAAQPLPGIAADTPQSTFFAANNLYGEGKYAEAVQAYENLMAGGVESANLYFNLGNSYFKQNRKGEAILNYERALQLAPGDPDIHANLSFARSLTGAEGCTPTWWQRLLFPLAAISASRSLWWITTIFYTLTLMLLTARRWLRTHPRALLYAAMATGAVATIAATSLGFRWSHEERLDLAVVTGSAEVAARFEPSATGTTHFTLKEGTRVAITDRREGWQQVERCDHRRGWMEQAALAPLR